MTKIINKHNNKQIGYQIIIIFLKNKFINISKLKMSSGEEVFDILNRKNNKNHIIDQYLIPFYFK